MVNNYEIGQVIIEGESKVLNGMGLGFLIGAGTGALIGLGSGDDDTGFFQSAGDKAAALAVLLGGAGFVVGTIAGITSSPDDKIIEPFTDHDFSSLRPFARFPLIEPEYLRAIK